MTIRPEYTAAPQDPMDMLAEEGCEVAIERMKAQRFGWDGTLEWAGKGNETPRQRFIQEVADFQVALEHAIDQKKITPEELIAAKTRKHDKLDRLFGLQRPGIELLVIPRLPKPKICCMCRCDEKVRKLERLPSGAVICSHCIPF